MRRWVYSCCLLKCSQEGEKENRRWGWSERYTTKKLTVMLATSPTWLSIFFFSLAIFFFIYSNSLWTVIYFPAKYYKKMEPWEPLKPAMVLRTIQFDHGLSGFMHFSHREVLSSKRTGMTRGSRLIQSDCTVWSRSENHEFKMVV